ncbi:MAG TPA: glycosyltransferase family 4 protein [Miltoncostaeales bacterium]|jgi:glycosyltransferase involved in cell wall biosynthesis|nr:glycosyltransferase family 4 protein [Miltoncostaeales bacterium]
MRVLYVSQYFVRGDQPGGVRHWHHTQALRERGHDVHIVTSYVQHKERTIPERFRGKKVVRESQDGVTMWFTYSTPGYGRDMRSRLSNYLSFATWSALAGFRAPRPDVVLASSPSLPSAAATALVALVKRTPFVFEVRDLWPESAIAMGLVRPGSGFARVAALLERFCYRRAAHVIALTDGIRDGVIAKGVAPQHVTLVTNGVDHLSTPVVPVAAPVPDDAFVAMYVGAHGTYSSLDTVLHAADLLRDRPDIRFIFVGGGDQKPGLMERARFMGLDTVTFIDSVPKSQVPAWLARADVCLLPYQDKALFAGALPNKTFDYMGAGKPILAAVPEGELTTVIAKSGCGVAVAPEDPAAMAAAIRAMADDRAGCATMGASGARYVEEHYDRARLAGVVCDILERVARR